MNAQSKLSPSVTTMTSRDFNQHTGRAKAAADHGPVIITDRGRPAYVLLSSEEYERLANSRPFVSAFDAVAQPGGLELDFELMDYIPERTIEPPVDLFGEE
jgi:prevent-host-death family protein